AGIEVGVGAADELVHAAAGDAARIAARDQHEVRVELAPHAVGRADLADHLLQRYHLLAGYVAAALGRDLVLDVDGGGAGAHEFLHGAHDIDGVAEAGIGIGDDRDLHGARDVARGR